MVRDGLVLVVKAYQVAIGPLVPSPCRFTPSCSVYAVEALDRHGTVDGLVLIVSRILRCQPLSRGGYDPVP